MLNIPIWTLFVQCLKAIDEKMNPWLILQVRPQNCQISSILRPNDLEDEGQGHSQLILCWKLVRILMHTKFGDIPSNGFWFIARTSIRKSLESESKRENRQNSVKILIF